MWNRVLLCTVWVFLLVAVPAIDVLAGDWLALGGFVAAAVVAGAIETRRLRR